MHCTLGQQPWFFFRIWLWANSFSLTLSHIIHGNRFNENEQLHGPTTTFNILLLSAYHTFGLPSRQFVYNALSQKSTAYRLPTFFFLLSVLQVLIAAYFSIALFLCWSNWTEWNRSKLCNSPLLAHCNFCCTCDHCIHSMAATASSI